MKVAYKDASSDDGGGGGGAAPGGGAAGPGAPGAGQQQRRLVEVRQRKLQHIKCENMQGDSCKTTNSHLLLYLNWLKKKECLYCTTWT